MLKKLFVEVVVVVVFLTGVFASISEACCSHCITVAKLKKRCAAEKTSATPAAPKITSPVVSEKGVEFVYANPKAKSVFVAGSFNDWNSSKDALVMDKKGVWKILMAVKPGSHQYKFVVDGNWLPDPSNPNTTDDSFGGVNSVVEVRQAPKSEPTRGVPQISPGGVRFTYKNPAAKAVFVAGEFNNWSQASDPMLKQKDGSWLLIKKLPAGKHQYKFIVDGNWLPDPSNPNTTDDSFGGVNSVIEIARAGSQGGGAVGPRRTKDGVEFTYINPNAQSVSIAGSFNNWNTRANAMTKDKDGRWKASVSLRPGKYQYKFVVDGNWLEDPSNQNFSDDGYGGKNSVVEVK